MIGFSSDICAQQCSGVHELSHLLTCISFDAQPRAYNRTELEDILGLAGEPNSNSNDSRPLLMTIVESLKEVRESWL